GCEADSVGFVGAEPQAANTRVASAATPSDRRPSPAVSVEARNHILRQLRLAVPGRFELGQRLEALFYPLVIDAIFRAHRIQLVRLDGLLFERIHLLLEQGVIFLELLALEILRSLRGQN